MKKYLFILIIPFLMGATYSKVDNGTVKELTVIEKNINVKQLLNRVKQLEATRVDFDAKIQRQIDEVEAKLIDIGKVVDITAVQQMIDEKP